MLKESLPSSLGELRETSCYVQKNVSLFQKVLIGQFPDWALE